MNIQYLYDNVEKAKRALSEANRLGRKERIDAFREFNEHYNALRQAQRGGKAKTYSADFETRVAGIPCGVVVLEYRDASGWSSNPEMVEPDDREFEFILVDRKGYRANWLERKLTECDCKRIESEYLAWREKR